MKNIQFKNVTSDSAELLIYGYIGDPWEGVSARVIVDQLAQVGGKKLTVRINSGGGYITEGFAIYNAIKAHKGGSEVYVDGIAGSIASLIAMAGDRVVMSPASIMFIHMPLVMGADGNAEQLRKMADDLDQFMPSLISAYTAKSGATAEAITELMKAESYLSPEKALSLKLIDAVEAPNEAKESAQVDGKDNVNTNSMSFLSQFKNAGLAESLFKANGYEFTAESCAQLFANAKIGAEVKAELERAASELTAVNAQVTAYKAEVDSLKANQAAIELERANLAATAAKQAADIVAGIGLSAPLVNVSGPASTAPKTDKELAEAWAAMPVGPERAAFLRKHEDAIRRGSKEI